MAVFRRVFLRERDEFLAFMVKNINTSVLEKSQQIGNIGAVDFPGIRQANGFIELSGEPADFYS